ncbi:MAG TPA: DUF6340 family protein [Prolixibacteraceae bacterium]|nr:DUF6340 family protein [Prolixibacteraceae bacterium]
MKAKQRTKPSGFVSLILLLGLILTACTTTYKTHSLQVEMMKPGLLAADSMGTIAIFNRDSNYNNCDTFFYVNIAKRKIIWDSLIKYKDLQETCLDTLAEYLKKSGYFKRVINYGDSLNNPAFAEDMANPQKKENGTNSMGYDACIFLDDFVLMADLFTNNYYFDNDVIANFPEFKNSTSMETVYTFLKWSISYPGDSSKHEYKRPDNLFYGNAVNPNYFGNEENHRKLINNAALSRGESFASELIPHLDVVERIYYHSQNPRMLLAEKNLLSENYLEAAEIYRLLTDNKNPHIVAKASYNMAFICEMEGNMDAALDWLNQSTNVFQTKAYVHKMHCTDYNTILAKRKEDIIQLEKQIRNNASNADN